MDSTETQLELSPETSPELSPETSPEIKKSSQRARSPAEWITLTLASLLLGVIVVLVLYDWQITKNIPPAFRIEIVEPARLTEGRYYVPFNLRNTGGHIARRVQVIAQLHLANGQDETGEQEFDFLSGNERKTGSFVFEHDPQKGDLVIRVASFGLP
jgi:uncharacterized protein (TIGR02588 family)